MKAVLTEFVWNFKSTKDMNNPIDPEYHINNLPFIYGWFSETRKNSPKMDNCPTNLH